MSISNPLQGLPCVLLLALSALACSPSEPVAGRDRSLEGSTSPRESRSPASPEPGLTLAVRPEPRPRTPREGLEAKPISGLHAGTSDQGAALERITLFDGDHEVGAYVSQALIAELGPWPHGTTSTVKLEHPRAELWQRFGSTRVWAIPGEDAVATLERLRARGGADRLVEVLHRGPHAASPFFVLPGGVFVELEPRLEAQVARRRLTELGLSVVRKLPFEGHVFLVRSMPGVAGLELASRLLDETDVVSTSPNRSAPYAGRIPRP